MSFGFGVGDIILACNTIYDYAKRYKDAPKEFDEIAEKARATAVLLERIDMESLNSDNIIARSGPEAEKQLQDNLASLGKDCEELEGLVRRYDKIHDEGYGRRMVWAFKEANGLTDMRRRIGYHEQTLQIWYMTIFCESLRRVEGVSEKTLEAINLVKQLTADQYDYIKRALARGDLRPLKAALNDSGICSKPTSRPSSRPSRYSSFQNKVQVPPSGRLDSGYYGSSPPRPNGSNRPEVNQEPRRHATAEEEEFNSTLKAMRDYIAADPVSQTDMESRLRTSMAAESGMKRYGLLSPRDSSKMRKGKERRPEILLVRRRSTGGQRSPRHRHTEQYDRDEGYGSFVNHLEPRRDDRRKPSPSKDPGRSSDFQFLTVPGESSRPRRSSGTPPVVHIVNRRREMEYEDDSGDEVLRPASRDRPGPAAQEFYRVISESDTRRRNPSQNSRGSDSHSRAGSTHSYERRRSVSRRRNDSDNDR